VVMCRVSILLAASSPTVEVLDITADLVMTCVYCSSFRLVRLVGELHPGIGVGLVELALVGHVKIVFQSRDHYWGVIAYPALRWMGLLLEHVAFIVHCIY